MAHKIALLQMKSGTQPSENACIIETAIEQAADQGAEILFTPEMAGMLDRDRKRAAQHIVSEGESGFLQHMAKACSKAQIALHIGSHAVAHDDGKWRNRSILFDRQGRISARYDKIHLFDVTLGNGDDWRESSAYGAGQEAVLTHSPIGQLGMTVCYDMRFPALYAALVANGAHVITVPAAFTVPTGKAHWHSLLRARAIEGQCFIIAAAQNGEHEDGRKTYGHSLVIDPWGDVLLDMNNQSGLGFASIDLEKVSETRKKLPSLANQRDFAKTPRIFTQ